MKAPDLKKQGSRASPSANQLLMKELFYLIRKIVLIILMFILAFSFVFGIVRNNEGAMVPAVNDGDLVFYYRLDKKYTINDLTIVSYENKKQVRRVVAAAGDTVDITEEGLLVNGALQQETGIYTETFAYTEGIDFPVTVGAGQVFLLADHRENAADSRIYGPVEINSTQGKVMTIVRRRNL